MDIELKMTLEKMSLLVVVVYLMFIVRLAVRTENADDTRDTEENSQEIKTEQPFPDDQDPEALEMSLQKYERLTQQIKDVELDAEAQSKQLYQDLVGLPKRDIVSTVGQIIELMNNPNYAYKFLKQKGIERVIIPNLNVSNEELKTQLLTLTKIIFDIAPTATTLAMPITVIDQLLEIFDHGNLALKSHVLDILYVWLPGNPKIQARVIRKKSLDVFYDNIIKMDTSTSTLVALDLLNKILVEHIEAKNQKFPATATERVKLQIYNSIGLLERMSTFKVCRGMLNIFESVWNYKPHEAPVPTQILELIKNLKPYCLNFYTGKLKDKAFQLLEKYLDHVLESNTEKITYDKEAMIEFLTKYADALQPAQKDEL